MKIIKSNEAMKGQNSDKCKTIEYSFDDKDLDLGVATITGRYPESGFCENEICKELIYVLDGKGELVFENSNVKFEKGDSILIYPKEKYYWNSDYCVLTMTCNPPWNVNQYKHS